MSRHIYRETDHIVVLGLDAPLNCYFGHVQHMAGEPSPLGDGSGFEATSDGLLSLLRAAQSFGNVPPTVLDSLQHDLESHLAGQDISYEKWHSESRGEAH